jgi:Na+-transporting NADH:ubiquinone oxidoreductase subunit NqrF
MTVAEQTILRERGVTGVRLSCQILCDQDMHIRVISRLEGSGRKDCGSPLAAEIEPQPVEWVERG